MSRWVLFALAAVLAVGCNDANQQYVRKAVSLMDKQGLFAEGPDWEAARKTALKAAGAMIRRDWR